MVKITEDIFLDNDKSGHFKLTKKVVKNKVDKHRKPTGETYEAIETIGYYGTVYQALTSLVRNPSIEGDILENLQEIVTAIDKASEEIKKNFRVEVRKEIHS